MESAKFSAMYLGLATCDVCKRTPFPIRPVAAGPSLTASTTRLNISHRRLFGFSRCQSRRECSTLMKWSIKYSPAHAREP